MSPIGYARVSTREDRQLLDRQLDALRAAGCERIFDDRMTGIQADRPGLIACLDHLRTGDVLVVLDLDRLGRRAHDLIGLIEDLEKRGIAFKALNSPMDTTTPAGRMVLTVFAGMAEFERALIHQRTSAGRAAAKARGVRFGRKPKLTADQKELAADLIGKGKSVRQAAALVNCHPATLYRALPVLDLAPD